MRKSCSHSAIAGIFGQWLYADLPEGPSGETSWHSGFRRRLAADAEVGAAARHGAVGSSAESEAAGAPGGRAAARRAPSSWIPAVPAIRPERRGERLDVESPQAPIGPLARGTTGARGAWTNAAVGGAGGHVGAGQAHLVPTLRPRLERRRSPCAAPPGVRDPAGTTSGHRVSGAHPALSGLRRAHRSRLARVGATQLLWSQCAGLDRSVVGRLPAEQAQHRRPARRRLQPRPSRRFGQPVGTACVRGAGGSGRRGTRLRAATSGGAHRRDRLARSAPKSLAVDRGQRSGHRVCHSFAPRQRGGP